MRTHLLDPPKRDETLQDRDERFGQSIERKSELSKDSNSGEGDRRGKRHLSPPDVVSELKKWEVGQRPSWQHARGTKGEDVLQR